MTSIKHVGQDVLAIILVASYFSFFKLLLSNWCDATELAMTQAIMIAIEAHVAYTCVITVCNKNLMVSNADQESCGTMDTHFNEVHM